MELNATEKKLVNGWQRGFPLTPQPYAEIGEKLGLGESQTLDMLASLKERGLLTRVGALVKPNTVGVSSLVAMAVEPDDLERVAAIVSNETQVNHNYERENELNLWFVVTAADGKELDEILLRIEENTGYQTIKLPLEKAYHIDLGFSI